MKVGGMRISLVLLAMGLAIGVSQAAELACGSVEGEFHRCDLPGADRMKVKLKQRLDGDCRAGETWGVDRDGVWVDMGCRGLFRYTAKTAVADRAGWRKFLPGWAR